MLANQHASRCMNMENHVRIYRKNPIAWWDKNIMRYLRRTYGKDKRKFILLRSVYLALCEIESDFADAPINSFTQTVGTYAGVSREVAGRCIKSFEKEKLISRVQRRDPKTNKFGAGTHIELLNLSQEKTAPASSEPLTGIADNGDGRQRGSQAALRNITNGKKLSIYNNVRKNPIKNTDKDQVAYYAEQLADKLNDQKSLSFYRIVCARYNPDKLLKKAAEIIRDGGARKPGAVFVHWIQTLRQ